MADRPPAMADRTATFVDLVIAIILPPLGVFLKVGCKIEFWICLLLTFLGYFPGIIYAVWPTHITYSGTHCFFFFDSSILSQEPAM
uniref:Uncharacterized protein n=1 Tax=Oryza rufipogon TaxID=4529 RepID=A0A0E0NVL1_ORYRU